MNTTLEEGHQRLFEERTPESAAWQIALVLAWATECQLATLEELKHRKSASKADIKRHASIAAKLVFNCKDLNVPPKGFLGRPCTRLAEYLEQPKEELLKWERDAEAALTEAARICDEEYTGWLRRRRGGEQKAAAAKRCRDKINAKLSEIERSSGAEQQRTKG